MSGPNDDTVEYSPVQSFAESFFAQAWKTVPMAFGAATHVGNVRSQNEDHFAILKMQRTTELLSTSLPPADRVVPEASSFGMIVADGMGGMRSGEYASRLAVRTMLELAGEATSWVMKFSDLDSQQIQQRAEAYVSRMHAVLQDQGRRDPAMKDMGTTWTSAHLLGQHALIAHLGDSRAYRLRDGRLVQITHDETMAQALVDSGVEPESVRKFRHVLNNSLGGGNDSARTTVEHLTLNSEDRLLLCTDGLTDMVSDDELGTILLSLSEPQAACDALVQRALEHGGKDNVTVALAVVGTIPD